MALIKHVFRRTKKLADADGSKESSDDEEFGGQDLKRWGVNEEARRLDSSTTSDAATEDEHNTSQSSMTHGTHDAPVPLVEHPNTSRKGLISATPRKSRRALLDGMAAELENERQQLTQKGTLGRSSAQISSSTQIGTGVPKGDNFETQNDEEERGFELEIVIPVERPGDVRRRSMSKERGRRSRSSSRDALRAARARSTQRRAHVLDGTADNEKSDEEPRDSSVKTDKQSLSTSRHSLGSSRHSGASLNSLSRENVTEHGELSEPSRQPQSLRRATGSRRSDRTSSRASRDRSQEEGTRRSSRSNSSDRLRSSTTERPRSSSRERRRRVRTETKTKYNVRDLLNGETPGDTRDKTASFQLASHGTEQNTVQNGGGDTEAPVKGAKSDNWQGENQPASVPSTADVATELKARRGSRRESNQSNRSSSRDSRAKSRGTSKERPASTRSSSRDGARTRRASSRDGLVAAKDEKTNEPLRRMSGRGSREGCSRSDRNQKNVDFAGNGSIESDPRKLEMKDVGSQITAGAKIEESGSAAVTGSLVSVADRKATNAPKTQEQKSRAPEVVFHTDKEEVPPVENAEQTNEIAAETRPAPALLRLLGPDEDGPKNSAVAVYDPSVDLLKSRVEADSGEGDDSSLGQSGKEPSAHTFGSHENIAKDRGDGKAEVESVETRVGQASSVCETSMGSRMQRESVENSNTKDSPQEDSIVASSKKSALPQDVIHVVEKELAEPDRVLAQEVTSSKPVEGALRSRRRSEKSKQAVRTENPAADLLGFLGSNYTDLIDKHQADSAADAFALCSNEAPANSVDFFKAITTSNLTRPVEEVGAHKKTENFDDSFAEDEKPLAPPSIAPSAIGDADKQKARRARRLARKNKSESEDGDNKISMLAPPSLAGDMPSLMNRKIRRSSQAEPGEGPSRIVRRSKSDEGPAIVQMVLEEEEPIKKQSARRPKIRRAKVDNKGDDDICAESLAPPSLAPPSVAPPNLAPRSRARMETATNEDKEMPRKVTRKDVRRANKFASLVDDGDDDDSVEIIVPVVDTEQAEKPKFRRGGMLSKAKSAVDVFESTTKRVVMKAASTRKLFA